jgi:hypothetical protein
MILLVLFWILAAFSVACLIYGGEYRLALMAAVISLLTMGLLPWMLRLMGVN